MFIRLSTSFKEKFYNKKFAKLEKNFNKKNIKNIRNITLTVKFIIYKAIFTFIKAKN